MRHLHQQFAWSCAAASDESASLFLATEASAAPGRFAYSTEVPASEGNIGIFYERGNYLELRFVVINAVGQ